MSLREEIVKILGYKEPLLCDGNHPRGKCKLEKVKSILSLFSKAVEEALAQRDEEWTEDTFIVNRHKTTNGFTYQWRYKNAKKNIHLSGTAGAKHTLLEAINSGYEYLKNVLSHLQETVKECHITKNNHNHVEGGLCGLDCHEAGVKITKKIQETEGKV